MELQHGIDSDDFSIGRMALNIAYVKPVEDDGLIFYAVCGADGSTLAIAPTRDLAFALTRQNDFEPQDAH
ncbi:MAG: DUF1150 family protein [Pseudomonadota bacterium]